jgi:hypothetical protein
MSIYVLLIQEVEEAPGGPGKISEIADSKAAKMACTWTARGLVASNKFTEMLCLAENLDPQSFAPVSLGNRTARHFSNGIIGTNLEYDL